MEEEAQEITEEKVNDILTKNSQEGDEVEVKDKEDIPEVEDEEADFKAWDKEGKQTLDDDKYGI